MQINRTIQAAITALVALGLHLGVASAAVIYDNAAVIVDAKPSDLDDDIATLGITSFVLADDFRLTADANTITGIQWQGMYFSSDIPPFVPSEDDFTIQIFASADAVGFKPEATPLHTFLLGDAVNRVDTGVNLGEFDLFEYFAAIPALTLSPDTPYWLSIFNNTLSDEAQWLWAYGPNPQALLSWGRNSLNSDWDLGSADQLDFRLTFLAVSEPGSLALLGVALAGLAFSRRKRNV